MKPLLKTKVIEIQYFDCGNPDHMHKSIEVAQRCMDERAKKTASRKWNDDSYKEVLNAHRAGVKNSELAKKLGLSSTRIGEVIKKAIRLESSVKSVDPFDRLSIRTRNCLLGSGFITVESVRAGLENGSLKKIPNFGSVSAREVKIWLETAE